MNQQIRITANRRRKVRVLVQRQAEMSQVFGAVARLALGTQDQFVDHVGARRSFDFFKDFVQAFLIGVLNFQSDGA